MSDEIPVPAGDEFHVPAGDEIPVPAGDEFHVPAGDEYSVPAGDEYSVPAGDTFPVPAGDAFPVPAGDAFPCRLCGRVYRSSSSRSAHERVHSGTTSCHICGRFLGKMGNLKRHLVNRHRMESGDAAELLRQRAAAPGAGRLTAGQPTDPDSALERLINQL
ncbi:Zinc finger and BTB domain-containing protein 49 [Amphibalanus amphitrite]|uniref:Zinc finger and BTB domain-containing protein 49 n=1 Tax=Amphibalanus amphitrite TaxID=1232801 RepID=A0A6A4VBE7_AMPAM|nr:Zinc finger and BTB domain-containing protein 49 [Amphibalanus amphitrite]